MNQLWVQVQKRKAIAGRYGLQRHMCDSIPFDSNVSRYSIFGTNSSAWMDFDCVSAWCRRKSDVLLVRVASDGRSIFIDDQSSGVPTTVLLQSVQTDDSSIGAGDLPMILKSVFANPDIVAMISGGINANEQAVSKVYVSFEFASLNF